MPLMLPPNDAINLRYGPLLAEPGQPLFVAARDVADLLAEGWAEAQADKPKAKPQPKPEPLDLDDEIDADDEV